MSKQLDAVKKYVVRLSAEERQRLEDMIHSGRHAAGRLARARILLKADVSEAGEGWSDSRIMEALDVSASLVYDVRKQLVEQGFEAVLTRKTREKPPTPAIFDGAKEGRPMQTELIGKIIAATGLQVEVGAEFAIDADEDVFVEGRSNSGSVVVGGEQDHGVLAQVDAEQEGSFHRKLAAELAQ